jgi:hypothetical protein
MRKLALAGLLFAFLPLAAIAQSSFDGTWKIDLKTAQLPMKPDVLLLQNGRYECKTCVPPLNVKADGQDQKITGHPYYNSVSIKVVNDRTIEETDKKDGKVVGTSTTKVAPDGKTATFEFTDSSNTNSAPVTGKGVMTRVADGPAGSNPISGSWRTSKLNNISENALLLTLKMEGNSLSLSTPTGQSYTAKLDGTTAPYKGDPGTNSVSVKRIAKNTIEETDMRHGKPVSVVRMTISADGKTMAFTVKNMLSGNTTKATANKQ